MHSMASPIHRNMASRCLQRSPPLSPPTTQHTRRPRSQCSSSIWSNQLVQDALQPSNCFQDNLGCQEQQQQQPQQAAVISGSQHTPAAAAITSTQQPQQQAHASRREAVLVPVLGGMAVQLGSILQPQAADASKLGAAADSAWEAMGGGPADLTFPDSWVGVWDVTSTLVAVDLPMGPEVLPAANKAAVGRAQQEDLNKPLQYQVAFMRNPTGRVVYDRRFNTSSLLATYYGSNVDFAGRITWDPSDPNSLKLTLPEGIAITTRVLRRSEQQVADDRFETSEFMQQVFDDGSIGRQPRVKASQCYTKFKFRPEAAAAAAGGPSIVATQVVNDFLTPFDDSAAYMAAANKPVTTYTYRMAFSRHHDVPQQVASVMHTS